VLCLGYTEDDLATILTGKEARRAMREDKPANNKVLVQFISLSGKIINTYSSPVTLTARVISLPYGGHLTTEYGSYLKHSMQIRNITGTGFAAFYGDETKRELLLFDTAGKLIRKKKIATDVPDYLLQTSGSSIYLLTKQNIDPIEGNYKLYVYNASDSVKEFSFDLKDKQGNELKVLSFDNDPVSGKAFLAGCVINPDRTKSFTTSRDYSNNPYLGVFTINLGATKEETKATYSYWYNETIPGINKYGLFADNDFYAKYSTAFRDFNGNTIFVGSAMLEKKLLGAAKYKFAEVMFVQQDSKGQLKLDSHVPCDDGSYFGPAGSVYEMDHKSYYKVLNQDTHTNFIIVNDLENTYIYNVNSKKTMRTIQHKDGRIKTTVFPAKEGHIMVSEYNRKEKTTRFSIEAV
jgi:hypothetical protein